MKVTVEMTQDEFMEFAAWKKDLEKYEKDLKIACRETKMFAKKVLWALMKDDKSEEKVKIIDHDHAMELLEMAKDMLA